MIKLFILITALGMPWHYDCYERKYTSEEVVKTRCEDSRALKPRVTFYWDADEAAKEYFKVTNPDRARVFAVEFWPRMFPAVTVKELQIMPAQTYEIIGSSVAATKDI